MLNRLARVVVIAALGLAPLAQAQTPASWEFLQSVGGIRIGAAQKDGNGWILPVECDLTGLRSITTDPTVLNSELVVDRLQWQADGQQLRVSVLLKETSYATSEATCPLLRLQGLQPGRYTVFYQDRDRQYPLGETTLEP